MKPTEDELRRRITNHLRWRGPTDTVSLLWHGYLFALLKWGAIDIDVYGRLNDLLPEKGNKELYELFLHQSTGPDVRKEMDDYLSKRRADHNL